MASQQDHEDDSFIILGTSPGTSLDLKCDIVNGQPLDKNQIEDAMKDMSTEANMALKAHFKLGDSPSPASLMVASTMITDDKSLEELQKRFGELLDENIILKETLKQNNDSLKEQFLLIASCQEDMMNTHKLHKEKFEETKGLVEKLRQENKQLKLDVVRLAESGSSSGVKSGQSSMLEFVTSPDDDTINKLTDQLELVEKQRRQVIVDNEKLTWQKESLEHIVDVTSKERDELREKLHQTELLLSNKETESSLKQSILQDTVKDLQNQIMTASSMSSVSSEEMVKRESTIRQLETKVSMLQNELKAAQLKILEFENVKLEYTRQKSGLSETVKMYKDQIQELKAKLKEAQTVVFQPVRVSVSPESDKSSEQINCTNNVKLYDKTLKHLSEQLNGVTHGLADNLVELLGVIASLYDFKLERATVEQFKAGLANVKTQLEKQHSAALANIGHVRGTLSIFEGIFKDYKELLKSKDTPQEASVQALTAALLARGQEVQALRAALDDVTLLRAQIDSYKNDFEAERECREKMACEKESLQADLRNAQKRIKDLTDLLQEARRQISLQTPRAAAGAPRSSSATSRTSTTGAAKTVRKKARLNPAIDKGASETEDQKEMHESTPPPQRFTCPVCDAQLKTLILLQQHVDSCLL
ncbi:NF-kappa-B essential modulator isoform X2 [Plodia interpunctella]|uniref:NF-kappa-B essential modulator isoform X2 n=1 Tax=Plodia interpunctella TaxID=58824 RepID=UPI002367C4AD|nr:NF-kappa-B essential modulator isoform X2 [Plodia interpunctella]